MPDPVSIDLGARSYDVTFHSLRTLPERMRQVGLRAGRCVVVTDANVAAHYRSPLVTALEGDGWTPHDVVLPPGEATKSASHFHEVLDAALAWGVDRQTPVIALGGGVVGDLAGFVAATLLRGVPLVQCPTSLLAQVDSSVGGKTAINHATGKNLIGAFYQPQHVCVDLNTLDTLPMREWTSGLAEVVKHALIADPDLFDLLESNLVPLFARKSRPLFGEMIRRAVQVKAAIVHEDERETGRRALLNFGHTVGHAIEAVAGYGAFTHGEAVAVGMRAGLYLSHRRAPEAIPRDRADHVLRAIPVEGDPSTLDFDALCAAMQSDKKNQGDTVRFVLLTRLGDATVVDDVSRDELRQAWDFATQ